MARRLIFVFLTIIILFTFSASVYAVDYSSIDYSVNDFWDNKGVIQSGDNTVTFSYPDFNDSNYDLSYSLVVQMSGAAYLIACPVSSTHTGQLYYSLSYYEANIRNETNNTYDVFYISNGSWVLYGHIYPNGWGSGALGNSTYYSQSQPFTYVGSNVKISAFGSNIFVFGNFRSSILNIISSKTDIEQGGIDYPVFFSGSNPSLGSDTLLSYIQVYIKKVNDSDFTLSSTIDLTNNTAIYNNITGNFSLLLSNLIPEDLAIGDQIKILTSWTVKNALYNNVSYDFYNVYTRSVAYTGGEAYVPPSEPGEGGSGGNSPDYSANFNELNDNLQQQTDAINQQTNSIEKTTQSVDNLNDNLMNQNTTAPNSIDIQDNTQNNTADLSSFFSSIQSAFTTRDSQDKFFVLTLPNGDDYTFTFPKTFIRNIITSNQALYTFVSAFWYIVFGVYIIFDLKKMYNKFKNGDFEGAMNSSAVDNVVKEALR